MEAWCKVTQPTPYIIGISICIGMPFSALHTYTIEIAPFSFLIFTLRPYGFIVHGGLFVYSILINILLEEKNIPYPFISEDWDVLFFIILIGLKQFFQGDIQDRSNRFDLNISSTPGLAFQL